MAEARRCCGAPGCFIMGVGLGGAAYDSGEARRCCGAPAVLSLAGRHTISAKAGVSVERCLKCRTIDELLSLCWLQIRAGDSGCLQRQDFVS